MDTPAPTPDANATTANDCALQSAQSSANIGARFKWTKRTRRAAYLVAGDELTGAQIAQDLGIGERTLASWKALPIFQAHVARLREYWGELAQRYAITKKAARLQALNDRWQRLKAVITERAVAPEMQAVAGGKQGVLVRTEKQIGSGENARTVAEYAVDTGLLKELRELEKQAAIEADQWNDKAVHAGAGQTILNIVMEVVPSPAAPKIVEQTAPQEVAHVSAREPLPGLPEAAAIPPV